MPNIPVSDLKPGMVLARPLSRGKMVLLGEGTVLTDTWILRIRDMDMQKACIVGPSTQPMPREEALKLLDARFQKVIDKPHMRQMNKIVRDHIESLYDQR